MNKPVNKNILLKIIIIFLSLFFSTLITSQSLTWQRYFNLLTSDDEGWAVCKADGNNIYVGGLSSDPGVGAVLKLNQYGDTLWKKFYPDSYYIVSMQSLSDGGCLFTSYSGKFKRLDQSGNVVWSINAPPGDILLTSDDFIIIAGYGSYSKYGMDGSHIWTKTYTVWPSFGFATEAIDGGYLFGGSVNYKAFLLKTDTSGSILWDRQYSFSNTSYFGSILKLNGNYIIAGSYYGSTDSSTKFLMKLKPNGDSLSFQKVYSRMPYYNQSLLNIGNNNIYFFYNYVSPVSNKNCIKIDLYDTNFIKKKHLIIEPKIHYLHINDAIVFIIQIRSIR